MSHEFWKPRAAEIAKVTSLSKARLSEAEAKEVAAFIEIFYARAAFDDVADLPVESLYGAALSAYKLGARRKPGAAAIQILTPNLSEHGWSSPHTVIQIVNDDMPFLVDSVTQELARLKLDVHRVLHPTMNVVRAEDGVRQAVRAEGRKGAIVESVMHIEIDEQADPVQLRRIEERLAIVLNDVRLAVRDWPAMLGTLKTVAESLESAPPPLKESEVRETVEFLRWLADNHFTVLGYREYAFSGRKGAEEVTLVAGSGLGVLSDPKAQVLASAEGLGAMSPEVRHFLQLPELMIITKANVRATVHRNVHMDYVSVKRLDAKGKLKGEHRFVGLFTSAAYNRSVKDIPILRRKVRHMLERAGFAPGGHDGKALANILETFPRDELFQIDEENLFAVSLGVMRLQERPRAKAFLRRDQFERFVSALVYAPREVYSTELRLKIEAILAAAFKGTISAHYALVGDSPLARVHFIVKTTPGDVPAVDPDEIDREIAEASRSWADKLRAALVQSYGEAKGNKLYARYAGAFSAGYRDDFSAELALFDIGKLEGLKDDADVAFNIYRPIEDAGHHIRLKIYHGGGLIPLSDCLPMIEHLGLRVLDEQAFEVTLKGGEPYWVHDFHMENASGAEIDLAAARARLEEALQEAWRGAIEDDGFNALVLGADLSCREVVILRAVFAYLRQVGLTFSQSYVEAALLRHPRLARMLVESFETKFDPAAKGGDEARRDRFEVIVGEFESLLEKVPSLDDDRILRRYLNVVRSMLRTNYFQPDKTGAAKPYVSFKLDSQALEELPLPRPFVEVFVYAPDVEGIHLRGGKVARGGIRWSDRREDFRTEILGLMKAQRVKNTVIVPVGAKGGFVPKRLPAGDREAILAEGVRAYKIFICGLLDITDNLSGGGVLPPKSVVRHDGDDPYLVVAADKGTATFSDTANALSKAYGFWLGDAFASGGSAGYDHKKMGITARGAWISVQRHFRELGHDVQTEPFTAIGVGDMSGDVFGNGMLMSRQIKLVAAFDHRHVFIDPDPDPMASYIERERLFGLARSSWADYDAKLISKGGGVFDRSAKSIALSSEMKALAGIDDDKLTPNQLIRALLLAEADLLWVGGIGTYCKASAESNAEVGDRANDSVRVDGRELNFKVVGEGGNLGFTQRGRMEYALKGGRLNTDAVDNSAGVDCSDHEVNIKILLNAVVADGEMTEKQRDRLLVEMTDEVAGHVLRDNYLQSQAISVAEMQAPKLIHRQSRLMRALEKSGRLNRKVEFLPDDEALAERIAQHKGLTRPEIAVVMAYAKMQLFDDLLASALPEDPFLERDLLAYFPKAAHKRFPAMIAKHRLRREIIATAISNEVINRGGPSFLFRIGEEAGADAGEIARAYVAAREIFRLPSLWKAIEGLDLKASAAIQGLMLCETAELLQRAVLWLLRHRGQPMDVAATIADFEPGVGKLAQGLDGVLSEAQAAEFAAKADMYEQQGAPSEVARRVAELAPLAAAADIVHVANALERSVEDVARAYFAVGGQLGFDWLRASADSFSSDDHWDRLAMAAIVDDVYSQQRALTQAILAKHRKDGLEALAEWSEGQARAIERCQALLAEMKAGGPVSVAKLGFAARHFRGLLPS